MANGTSAAPGVAFPRETFAKLTPGPFLQAHLKQPQPVRPSGRGLDEFRKPSINTGSLSHSNGSAVVRLGNTAVVCGVRAEILLASDIPHPPAADVHEDDVVEQLSLLVPNVELSTGCSPNHLPGNPPGTHAQALSYRILSLLNTSTLVSAKDLRIQYTQPPTDDDLPDDGPQVVSKAYWTLYIDILCIALDGNAFDAAWAAVVTALQDTKLPKAWWDPDREAVMCSPLISESNKLRLDGLPSASTFAVFSTSSPLKQRAEAETWVLADPDGFEEDVCAETVTVVVEKRGGRSSLLAVEKHGGSAIDKVAVGRCMRLAKERFQEWESVLRPD